jgi:hypothetical protein
MIIDFLYMELRLGTCEYDWLKIVLFFYSMEERKKYGFKDKSRNNSSSKEADI